MELISMVREREGRTIVKMRADLRMNLDEIALVCWCLEAFIARDPEKNGTEAMTLLDELRRLFRVEVNG